MARPFLCYLFSCSLQINDKHCSTFLDACSDYIQQQQIVKEFISAIAALSKCDEKGWTPFEQDYLYKIRDPVTTTMLAEYKKSSSNTTNNLALCQKEYSLSTMIGSDLRKREYWLEFATNAESIFTKYKMNMSQTVEYLYQADDEHSTKQDLPDFKIEQFGVTDFLDYYANSNFEPEITDKLLEEITATSRLYFLSWMLLFALLSCI